MNELDAAYVLAWLRAFVFTEVVETPIYWRFARAEAERSESSSESAVRARANENAVRVWRGFAASAITHPFVWFAFPLLTTRLDLPWTLAMVLAELFAWWVEAAFLVVTKPRVPIRRAVLVSLGANAASVVTGLICRHFLGYP